MTQEAAQKCLEAASPEAEVRKTFPLFCNLGDCLPGAIADTSTKSLIIIIVNDMK